MKNNLLSWLHSTGLDEQRAQIYLAALSRGEATASDLATDLKIGRTTMYDNLRILKERGYMQLIHRGKRKVFIPLHPKELYKKIENQKEQLKELLPDFLSLYANTSERPFVQMFDGNYAAREVFEDILRTTKKEYIYFSPPNETFKMVHEDWIKKWVTRRVKKGIQSRSLRVKSKTVPASPMFNEETEYLRHIRFILLQSWHRLLKIQQKKQQNSEMSLFQPNICLFL
jgi:sugar-specific transcriptional regulator TrmB